MKVKVSALKGKKIKELTQEEELAIQFCIEHWSVEDVREEHRKPYEKVRSEGLGVCGSCRWTSGCLRCDEKKAWNYYVRQVLGLSGSVAKKSTAKH